MNHQIFCLYSQLVMGLCFFINLAPVKVVVLTKDEEIMVHTKYTDVYVFVCVCVCVLTFWNIC